jgi:hypothetical protein
MHGYKKKAKESKIRSRVEMGMECEEGKGVEYSGHKKLS